MHTKYMEATMIGVQKRLCEQKGRHSKKVWDTRSFINDQKQWLLSITTGIALPIVSPGWPGSAFSKTTWMSHIWTSFIPI